MSLLSSIKKKKKSPQSPVSGPPVPWKSTFHSPLSASPRNRLSNLGLATGSLILLCFILLHFVDRYCVFYKLKLCGNPASSKPIATIFTTPFAHFRFLCHILVILAIFQAFSLSLYLLWWSVITDLCCYYCNCSQNHKPHPYKMMNLIDICCMCSDCSDDWPFPSLSLSLGLPIPWDTTIWELGPLTTL